MIPNLGANAFLQLGWLSKVVTEVWPGNLRQKLWYQRSQETVVSEPWLRWYQSHGSWGRPWVNIGLWYTDSETQEQQNDMNGGPIFAMTIMFWHLMFFLLCVSRCWSRHSMCYLLHDLHGDRLTLTEISWNTQSICMEMDSCRFCRFF